jgi:tetratricopeptide (TPR) repeat protein
VDADNAAPGLLEFQRLIPDSVGIALRAADPADFLLWVRQRLLKYAVPNSPLLTDAVLGRAMAFAWAHTVGNPPRPMPEPGPDDPCPCGSGKRFQECCLPIPLMPPLTQEVLWPYVLANTPQADRDELLSSSRIPRASLIEFAAYLLDMRRHPEVIAALEPRLGAAERYYDEDTAILLHLLCEAYDLSTDGARRKLKLLRETIERAPRSPLRSESWQRLATIYMDRGDSDGAWTAFRNAQLDNPQADELCVLEVELLVAGHHMEDAKQLAREWVDLLSGQGVPPDDPRIEFLTRMAVNPLDPVTYTVQGAGGPLRDWLLHVTDRRPVQHRLVAVGSSPGCKITAPPEMIRIQQLWHDVFPLLKPFSAQDQPFDGDAVWEPRVEARWCEFLRQHPEAFDSLDILDDLATAVGRHAHAQSAWVDALLLTPLLTRSSALVDLACQAQAEAILPWDIEENRVALRALFRLFQQQLDGDDQAVAIATGRKLLRLNPADHHAVGAVLQGLTGS